MDKNYSFLKQLKGTFHLKLTVTTGPAARDDEQGNLMISINILY